MKTGLPIFVLICFVTTVTSCTRPAVPSGGSSSASTLNSPSSTVKEDDVLYYINNYRHSKRLPPLKLSPVITAEAKKHSSRMATGKVSFSHTGFSGRIQRISTQVGSVRESAENVASGSTSAKEVVDRWVKSPVHKQNIEGNYTLTGIGIARSSKGTLYYTQIFIRN